MFKGSSFFSSGLGRAPEALGSDRAAALDAIAGNRYALSSISDELSDDARFMLDAVEQFGVNVLFYATERLQGDAGFILDLVEENADALNFTPLSLQRDKTFILDAIEKNADVLSYICASSILLGDADFMLAAVERNEDAIKYLSPELRAKDGFMLDMEVRRQNRTDCATQEREEGACGESASKRLIA